MTKVCRLCGEPFVVKPYRAESAHYCSQTCARTDPSRRHDMSLFILANPIPGSDANRFQVGHRQSAEARAKMSKAKQGHTPWNKGVPMTDEVKQKVSAARKGKRGGRTFVKGQVPWNKGIGDKTPEQKRIRTSPAYRAWRLAVFVRDDYTCVLCGERGGNLNADHILRFSDYPELRLDTDNGRTLCEPCHKQTDTYGNRKNSETSKWRQVAAA